MNKKIWLILVAIVCLITFSSFLFLFSYHEEKPYFLHLPYIFWIGILQTILLVVCTFLGAKFFPFKEKSS